jgi:hypothetical protein
VITHISLIIYDAAGEVIDAFDLDPDVEMTDRDLRAFARHHANAAAFERITTIERLLQ